MPFTAHFLSNALELAHYSGASYLNDPRRSNSFARLGAQTVSTISRGSDFVWVASAGRHLVVAIRGSDDINDWEGNASFKRFVRVDGQVHRGFYEAMKRLRAPVRDALESADYRDKTIWFTGHSRGGALAVLLAEQFATEYSATDPERVPDFIYTFGAPRVGDIDFYRNYDLRDRTYLFVNEADPVPRLPPNQSGYYHVDRQHLLIRDAVTEVDLDESIVSVDWQEAMARLQAGRPDFSDHDLHEGYIRNLAANAGE